MPTATLDLTAYQAALKQMYPRKRIENLTFKKNPFFAMVRKDTSVGGENWKVPVQYEDIGGRSAGFSTAQSNKNISRKIAFLLTSVNDYALASVEGKVWRASQGNDKAFMEASRSELDSAFNAMRRSLGIAVYRSGTGAIGQINATVTGTTLTLTNRHDVNNFGRGQFIVFSDTDGGALRDSGAQLEITAINRTAGSMTVGANLNTITGIAASDFISIAGDAANGGTNVRMTGLSGWLPATAPTSGDSHFGVDRSVDSVRLAGNIVSATGLTIEEALIRAATEIDEQGGDPDCVFCQPITFEQLGLELGAKKEYADTTVAGVHFQGIKIHSGSGTINIYADRNCPVGTAYMLEKDTWTLYSIGECPGILDLDRVGAFLRESTADAYEMRIGCYPQLGCHAPGHNAVITNLPTT